MSVSQEKSDDAGADHAGGPGRLIGFSDGVMAVIITIMALELTPPDGTDIAALGHEVPKLLVYMLSFVGVGIYWNNHHHLMRASERISATVMWANLHLLFWLSLLPLCTDWVGKQYGHTIPAMTYGCVALGCALSWGLLARALVAANDERSLVARVNGTDVKGRVSEAVYLVGIGLGFVSPYLTYACCAMVSVMWFVPDRRYALHKADRAARGVEDGSGPLQSDVQ